MASYMCVDIKCKFDSQERKEGYCPECGKKLQKVGFKEAVKLKNNKKEYQKSPINYELKEERAVKAKAHVEALEKKKQRDALRAQNATVGTPGGSYNSLSRTGSTIPPAAPKGALFRPSDSEAQIISSIYSDMNNLANHEAGTKWMRIGTLLSFNATQQMIGAGFKALIDQNKILIKQNELIYRELKQLNSQSKEKE